MQLGPLTTSCLWAGGPAQSLTNPCPGPQIFWSFWPLFLLKKVNFCHFAYQGSVKMPFWPYFDLILSPPEPNFWPCQNVPIVPLVREGPWRTLRDPNLTLILTILDPFWGSWREAAARPRTSCLWVGGPVWSLKTHARDLNFGHFDHFSYWKSQFCHFAYQGQWKCHFDPILTPFEPSWAKPLVPGQMCLFRPTARMDLGGTLGTQIWPYFDHFGPFWRSFS